jgi:YD repeat-containing protein
MHRKMPPATTIFAREKNPFLGKGSFPISVDSFLGIWNRTKYSYDAFNRRVETVTDTNGATAGGQSSEFYFVRQA